MEPRTAEALLVDDEEFPRDMLGQVIQRASGLLVEAYRDLDSAIAAIRSNDSLKLVVSDLNLLGSNDRQGLKVVKVAKSERGIVDVLLVTVDQITAELRAEVEALGVEIFNKSDIDGISSRLGILKKRSEN